MSFRSAQIYVEQKTVKRLRLALTLYPKYKTDAETGVKSVITTDQLGDSLINETIEIQFPLVVLLEKELARTEKAFIATHQT